MPITATFGMIFLVAKVDVVGPNPIARSNNKRRLPKGSLFLLLGEAERGATKKWVRQGREADGSTPTRRKAERERSGKANPCARTIKKNQGVMLIHSPF